MGLNLFYIFSSLVHKLITYYREWKNTLYNNMKRNTVWLDDWWKFFTHFSDERIDLRSHPWGLIKCEGWFSIYKYVCICIIHERISHDTYIVENGKLTGWMRFTTRDSLSESCFCFRLSFFEIWKYPFS